MSTTVAYGMIAPQQAPNPDNEMVVFALPTGWTEPGVTGRQTRCVIAGRVTDAAAVNPSVLYWVRCPSAFLSSLTLIIILMGRVGRSKVWRWRHVVIDVHGLLAVNVSEVLFIYHILRHWSLVIVLFFCRGFDRLFALKQGLCKADENKKKIEE